MEVTDEYVMPFLNVAANQGVTLIGLTARGKEHLSATLMQLKDNKFLVDEKLLFKKYGLKINNKTSIAGNFHCPQFSREVIYQQGIMFLDGEDKGEALLCTLANTKQEIKTIIFVDDAKRNSASIDKAFANRNDLLILNVLYTKENAKELKIQADPHIQTLLFEQWNFIKRNLNDVIIDSNF
jgi:phage pi2 protein 07